MSTNLPPPSGSDPNPGIRYEIDTLGRVMRQIDPDGRVTSHCYYDAATDDRAPAESGGRPGTVTHVYIYDGQGRPGPPPRPADGPKPDDPFIVDG